MELLNPVTALNRLQQFLNSGGPVLLAIMVLAFFLWAFIFERLAYYQVGHKPMMRRLTGEWSDRTDKSSWRALAIRDELVSQVKINTGQNVDIIKTLVALAPLLGLLGTVTGMIEVFDKMALSGSSNARDMAGGIFKATIPTMAGMTVALSGMFFPNYFERKSRRETAKFSDLLGGYDA